MIKLILYASCLGVISYSYAQPPNKVTDAAIPIQAEQPVISPSTLPTGQQIAPDPFKPSTPEEDAEDERRWAAHEVEQQKYFLKKFGHLPPGAASGQSTAIHATAITR